MKKILFTLFVCAMLLGLSVAVHADRAADKKLMHLADTPYFVTVSDNFRNIGVSEEDRNNGIVGRSINDASGLEMTLYQIDSRGYMSNQSYAINAASKLGTTAKSIMVNGISTVFYSYDDIETVTYTETDEDGEEYSYEEEFLKARYLNYVFSDNGSFLEISFKIDDITEEEAAMIIITTEKRNLIQLGRSEHSMFIPASFTARALSAADISEGQVAYYASDKYTIDFDIYQYAKTEESPNLVSFANEFARELGTVGVSTKFNDVPVVYYYATESYEGIEHRTLTYVVEDGKCFIKIVFWLDGESFSDAMDIIETLR